MSKELERFLTKNRKKGAGFAKSPPYLPENLNLNPNEPLLGQLEELAVYDDRVSEWLTKKAYPNPAFMSTFSATTLPENQPQGLTRRK